MIKLKCPNCDSDDVFYNDVEETGDTFKCDDCEKTFCFNEAEWEQE